MRHRHHQRLGPKPTLAPPRPLAPKPAAAPMPKPHPPSQRLRRCQSLGKGDREGDRKNTKPKKQTFRKRHCMQIVATRYPEVHHQLLKKSDALEQSLSFHLRFALVAPSLSPLFHVVLRSSCLVPPPLCTRTLPTPPPAHLTKVSRRAATVL